MATIQKVKRRSDYAYRVLIRQAGMKSVTETFNTKRLANKFVNSIKGDRNNRLDFYSTYELIHPTSPINKLDI
jgi:hypothetical protein